MSLHPSTVQQAWTLMEALDWAPGQSRCHMFIGNSAAPRDVICRCWNGASNVHFASNRDSNADDG